MDKKFKKDFIKGSASTTIGQAFSMGFHFVSVVLLTRFLPISDFGIYSLILAITYFFNTISSFGLEVTMVKFISSENEDEKRFTFLPVMILKFITTTTTAFIFYFISSLILPLFGEGLENFEYYIIILFFLGSFRDVFYNLLQGLNYFRKYAIIQFSSAFIRVLFILGLIYFKEVTLINIVLLEIVINSVTIIIHLSQIPFRKLINYQPGTEIYRKIVKFSLPVYFNNIFTMMHSRINLFIIGIYISPASVAFYDVASKIPEALKKLFDSFILVFFPNMSRLLSKDDKKASRELLSKSLRSFTILLSILAVISFIFREDIIGVIFSEKYLESSMAFTLLMVNFLFRAIANMLGYTHLSSGHPEIPMRVNIISSIISIGGGLILIPAYGFIGAVYALLLMNIVSQTLYYLKLNRLELRPDLKLIVEPLFLLLAIFILFAVIGLNNYWFKILVLFIYIFLNLFILKDFNQFTINLLKQNLLKKL